jgi:hypothetical protein
MIDAKDYKLAHAVIDIKPKDDDVRYPRDHLLEGPGYGPIATGSREDGKQRHSLSNAQLPGPRRWHLPRYPKPACSVRFRAERGVNSGGSPRSIKKRGGGVALRARSFARTGAARGRAAPAAKPPTRRLGPTPCYLGWLSFREHSTSTTSVGKQATCQHVASLGLEDSL